MGIVVVNYSDNKYRVAQRELNKSCVKYGISKIFSYNDTWLKTTNFYKKNLKILDCKRGAGFWAWKPFVILTALKKIGKNDTLVYLDSGTSIINNLNIFEELCKKNDGVLLFDTRRKNKIWTKRDCFVAMNCDSKIYWDTSQAYGTFQVYQDTSFSRKFLTEYLSYCEKEICITDTPNTLGKKNFPCFKDHRHDQSILSNLAQKFKIKLYPDPSQYGNTLKRPYPQLIDSHRDTKDLKSKIRKLTGPIRNLTKNIMTAIFSKHRL